MQRSRQEQKTAFTTGLLLAGKRFFAVKATRMGQHSWLILLRLKMTWRA